MLYTSKIYLSDKTTIDIVERLNDPEKCMDAVDEAADEILRVRGLLFAIIDCFDKGSADIHVENAIDNAREYMKGE